MLPHSRRLAAMRGLHLHAFIRDFSAISCCTGLLPFDPPALLLRWSSRVLSYLLRDGRDAFCP
eukprot:3383580-Pyramimonas_sp.AAC.1